MLSCYQLQMLGICEVCATYLRAELPFMDSNQEDRGSAKGGSKDSTAMCVPHVSPRPVCQGRMEVQLDLSVG